MDGKQIVGTKIGEYRVERLLGEGAMGVVFEAVDDRIQRRVAIKLLRAEISAQPEIAARFLQEAVAANQIDHPGIVSVQRHGQLEDGSYYLIMEFLRGVSLFDRLQARGGRLPGTEVIRIGRQVASALSAAHARGIIHRDLKPANLMLVPDPDMIGGERVKVLDFGIAKMLPSGGSSLDDAVKTATSMVIGTPTYMAPEQILGAGRVDERADVYSLGTILYQMVAGRPPFVTDGVNTGVGALLVMHVRDSPRPLRELCPETRPDLAALVMRMLSKVPGERPSMAEVASTLAQLQQTEPAPTPLPASVEPTVSAALVSGHDYTRLATPVSLLPPSTASPGTTRRRSTTSSSTARPATSASTTASASSTSAATMAISACARSPARRLTPTAAPPASSASRTRQCGKASAGLRATPTPTRRT